MLLEHGVKEGSEGQCDYSSFSLNTALRIVIHYRMFRRKPQNVAQSSFGIASFFTQLFSSKDRDFRWVIVVCQMKDTTQIFMIVNRQKMREEAKRQKTAGELVTIACVLASSCSLTFTVFSSLIQKERNELKNSRKDDA